MSARWPLDAAFFGVLLSLPTLSCAQDARADEQNVSMVSVDSTSDTGPAPTWIDRTHSGVHSMVWHTAMYIDRLFGATPDERVYQKLARGSITPAVLWDEYNGLSQKFRFRVKLPLPHLDERYDAFIGTFSRDEYVTGREQESGAIPQQHPRGEIEQEETLVGIRYREPEKGGRWEADAGLRIRSPIDPFVKAGYRYERGAPERIRFTWRETVFWQNSEQFGLTSRVDLDRIVDENWSVRWTGSGTISEKSEGVRGYTSLTAYRGLSHRRAIGAQLFTAGEFDAAVPLGEFGAKVAYRQSILRDWLVIEIRPSVTWPKVHPWESRAASWGLGIGFEMFIGDEEFQARPATF